MGDLKKIILFTILFLLHPTLSASFQTSEMKLWLWMDYSQLYLINHNTHESLLLYFEYNEEKTQLTNIEIHGSGLNQEQLNSYSSHRSLIDLLDEQEPNVPFRIFFYGPREIDPLGPQPGQLEDGYLIVGNKRVKARPVFPPINWSMSRTIKGSQLEQKQIDFLLFKMMILSMLQSDQHPPVSIQLTMDSETEEELAQTSCRELF